MLFLRSTSLLNFLIQKYAYDRRFHSNFVFQVLFVVAVWSSSHQFINDGIKYSMHMLPFIPSIRYSYNKCKKVVDRESYTA